MNGFFIKKNSQSTLATFTQIILFLEIPKNFTQKKKKTISEGKWNVFWDTLEYKWKFQN